MIAKIVKLEKGVFVVEYKNQIIDKTFRTRPKAEEYIRKHFSNTFQNEQAATQKQHSA